MRNVGTHGYALCSSPFAADGSLANRAGFLNFNSGNVNPITNAYRCEAFPVRCVQASAPKLFLLFFRYLWLALKILPFGKKQASLLLHPLIRIFGSALDTSASGMLK